MLKTVQTDIHREHGSRGLVVNVDQRGHVEEWRLRDGGVWTATLADVVERDVLGDPTAIVETYYCEESE